MTKQETQIMKGVAILLMIFLHLFNQIRNVELCIGFQPQQVQFRFFLFFPAMVCILFMLNGR